jgi:hypothetical protein
MLAHQENEMLLFKKLLIMWFYIFNGPGIHITVWDIKLLDLFAGMFFSIRPDSSVPTTEVLMGKLLFEVNYV